MIWKLHWPEGEKRWQAWSSRTLKLFFLHTLSKILVITGALETEPENSYMTKLL